ncbi:hypothetical protein BVX97_04925 [bacterium E08(2017)]|nr:hypothetical protein BVX97_04925 [bacterium E08(2017)]
MASDLFDISDEDSVQILPISEAGLNRLAKQKEEVHTQVAGAAEKIEQLRSKQNSLEQEKRELEELASKQAEYESGKKEMIENLSRWILLLKKEHAQAIRMVELVTETAERFKESLNDLEKIEESKWVDGDFQLELNRALVKVDIARSTFNKAVARIEAASWHKKSESGAPFDIEKEARREVARDKGFFYWLMVGIAVTLPLIITIVTLFIFWRYDPSSIGV